MLCLNVNGWVFSVNDHGGFRRLHYCDSSRFDLLALKNGLRCFRLCIGIGEFVAGARILGQLGLFIADKVDATQYDANYTALIKPAAEITMYPEMEPHG